MKKQNDKKPEKRDDVLIKYVHAAKSWCVTKWESGIQKQTWYNNKEDIKV